MNSILSRTLNRSHHCRVMDLYVIGSFHRILDTSSTREEDLAEKVCEEILFKPLQPLDASPESNPCDKNQSCKSHPLDFGCFLRFCPDFQPIFKFDPIQLRCYETTSIHRINSGSRAILPTSFTGNLQRRLLP